MKSLNNPKCNLCKSPTYPLVWQDKLFRVVLVNDQSYPGYCRVESLEHIKEMTDMSPSLRNHCMTIVFKVEEVLKLFFTPDKINLSALGNITPHIHWHIIPRFNNDNHFPLSIWSNKKRDVKKEMARKDEVKLINLIQTALNQ